MSLKDNVDYVKEELSSEEKFLESFVKVERFYKKYRLLIILGGVVAISLIVAFYLTKYIQGNNKLEANVLYNKVLENPEDTQALNGLKDKNEQLYQIAQYLQNKNSDVQIKYLKELSAYKTALEKKDIEKLNSLSMQNDFLLKEFAIFNKALILTQEGKFEDAKATLKLIPSNSKVSDLVTVLNHYLVTK